ncbi:MAG: nucleotidyl transferase AbiEii/AbiGii toxin family protein [Chloroflexi bacterium]|nr:nucleotidyl transferase AbiEii/AbiGii toxin family protein [Chloroflexota bacterium]
MNLLTPFQQQIIEAISRSDLKDHFYMTGGTALAVFYLQHRYSLDLDFFTADPTAVSRAPASLEDIAHQINAQVSFIRILGTFIQCFFQNADGERVQIDFAQDSPYRLEPVRLDKEMGIQVENLVDIASNKLSALFDRAEPKDFVDIYFICQNFFPFDELVEKTRQKHLGLDDYWLAIALQRVEQVEILPRMIKPITLEELKIFFLNQAKRLMDRSA